MDQKQSGRLGREMVAAHKHLPGEAFPPSGVLNAVFAHVSEFVPAEAVAAVIEAEPGDGAGSNQPRPLLVAVDKARLYSLECLPADDDGNVGGKSQLITLEPGKSAVEVEARYVGQQTSSQPPIRRTIWRFNISGKLNLTLRTTTSPDGELGDQERLARNLATSLGWRTDHGW